MRKKSKSTAEKPRQIELPDGNIVGMDRAGNIVAIPGEFESKYQPDDTEIQPQILITSAELAQTAEKLPAAVKRLIAYDQSADEIEKLENRLNELREERENTESDMQDDVLPVVYSSTGYDISADAKGGVFFGCCYVSADFFRKFARLSARLAPARKAGKRK